MAEHSIEQLIHHGRKVVSAVNKFCAAWQDVPEQNRCRDPISVLRPSIDGLLNVSHGIDLALSSLSKFPDGLQSPADHGRHGRSSSMSSGSAKKRKRAGGTALTRVNARQDYSGPAERALAEQCHSHSSKEIISVTTSTTPRSTKQPEFEKLSLSLRSVTSEVWARMVKLGEEPESLKDLLRDPFWDWDITSTIGRNGGLAGMIERDDAVRKADCAMQLQRRVTALTIACLVPTPNLNQKFGVDPAGSWILEALAKNAPNGVKKVKDLRRHGLVFLNYMEAGLVWYIPLMGTRLWLKDGPTNEDIALIKNWFEYFRSRQSDLEERMKAIIRETLNYFQPQEEGGEAHYHQYQHARSEADKIVAKYLDVAPPTSAMTGDAPSEDQPSHHCRGTVDIDEVSADASNGGTELGYMIDGHSAAFGDDGITGFMSGWRANGQCQLTSVGDASGGWTQDVFDKLINFSP